MIQGRDGDAGLCQPAMRPNRNDSRGWNGQMRTGPLAMLREASDIARGRLAADEPLANRVRSGRKQP
jgi:hypothetical protein